MCMSSFELKPHQMVCVGQECLYYSLAYGHGVSDIYCLILIVPIILAI